MGTFPMLLLALALVSRLHAQTAGGPPGASPSAGATFTDQAPADVIKRIADLVSTGKYPEAREAVAALRLLYPQDERLAETEARLNRAAGSSSASYAVAPGGGSESDSLNGTDRLEYNTLLSLLDDADHAPEANARLEDLKHFLDQGSPFAKMHPNLQELWLKRAKAAIEIDDFHSGHEAGQRLEALGLVDSHDPEIQKILVELNRRGWLAKNNPYRGPQEGRPWTVPDNDLEMVWIIPGKFIEGSPPAEKGRGEDEAPHEVTLTKGFWLGKYPVTTTQWQKVMGDNPCADNMQTGEAPVESVTWSDAAVFCRKLTDLARMMESLPDGYEYTLPTEAQWEYACRAGNGGPYGGDGVLDHMGWYKGNSKHHKHPVGQKKPNAWGLYDMNGDVWQWCLDWYGPYPAGSVTDPIGTEAGSGRVNRGGCWMNQAAICRSAVRGMDPPEHHGAGLGLRLALARVRP